MTKNLSLWFRLLSMYRIKSPLGLPRKKNPYRIIVNLLFVFIVGPLFLFSLFFLQAWLFFAQDLPETKALVIAGEESSEILDRDGNLLKILYLTERRIYVPLSDISPYALDATVSSEDERFFQHHGVDLKAVVRALITNLLTIDYTEGGSTITQQLARNVFLSKDKTLTRKIREIILSFRIEQRFTKSEILELYLNQAYFGEGCYGIETASRKYFGKNAKDLSLEEASLLISVLPAPSALSIFTSLDKIKPHQRNVLQKMVENHYISQKEANEAYHQEVNIISISGFSDNETLLPDNLDYFVDYVKEEVVKKMSAQELYKGGLRIHTTLHPSIQRLCNQKFQEVLQEAEKNQQIPSQALDTLGVIQPQGAVVAVSPANGQILAMIGGRSYENTKFNRCLAERQSGSSFKVFPYVAAIDQGLLGPDTILSSEAINIDGWKPREWTSGFFGSMSVRRAIAISSNIVAVKVALRAGLDNVAKYAEKMGLKTPMLAVPSMALGSLEVRPLDMAMAYSVLSNGGKHHEPQAILWIEKRKTGQKLFEANTDKSQQVVSPQAAFLMTDLLKEPFTPSGTASALRIPGVSMAGKTGTTENFRDGWFVGYTPSISLSVYVGSDSKDIDLSAVQNYGSVFAGQIFKKIVQTLYQQKYFIDEDWKVPQGLVRIRICRETNLKANSSCPVIIDTRIESSLLGLCPKKHPLPEEKEEKKEDSSQENKDGLSDQPNPQDPKDSSGDQKPLPPTNTPPDQSSPNVPDRSLYEPPKVDTGDFSISFGTAYLRVGSPTEINFQIFDPQGRSVELYLAGQLVAILTDYPYRYYYLPDTSGIILLQAVLRDSSHQIIGNKILNFYVFP